MSHAPRLAHLLAALVALILCACQREGASARLGEDFVSDDPFTEPEGDGDPTGDGDPGDPGPQEEDGEDGDALELSEADIVQLEGDTLYALSTYSGLNVVDVSDPDAMRALGIWEAFAEPFEMYVDAAQVFAMFNDFAFWEYDEDLDAWSERSSSRLVALDAGDPAAIEVTGEFTLPGRIQDSRRVGDILYLVTLEDGACWGCDGIQRTVVSSLDVGDPASPALVDQLEFPAEGDSWDWRRSVASTTERMYLAAQTSSWEGLGSFIDVVDISAGDGSLVAGARVEIAGSVSSRWQMDEHAGVLRVVSQQGEADDPVIETFTIVSANELTPLGTGSLVLPKPESLRSVRFDGDKAYAITAFEVSPQELEDPLFTIDLSDPAAPTQRGELEIPGWVFHIEPRGDRLLALGFDPGHPEGSVNVSLFDVGVFDQPALIRRVHFGLGWASLTEDQDQIHKAFSVLDDEGMVLVPFSAWSLGPNPSGCGGDDRSSGVQIVDWLADDLSLRGVVPLHGRPRRAFTHRQRLVTMSDVELGSYDYADRDNPVRTDELRLATDIYSLVPAGDVWLRLGDDGPDGQQIEIVDDPTAHQPLAIVDFGEREDCEWSWIFEVHVIGDHAFAVADVQRRVTSDAGNTFTQRLIRVSGIDLSDPTNPAIADELELEMDPANVLHEVAGVGLESSRSVALGQQIVLDSREWSTTAQSRVVVLDVSDPAAIQESASLYRPFAERLGGLARMSDTVVSWHTELVPEQPGKVRFYFDRLILGEDPEWAPSVNVPGVVVAYDADAGTAYSVDFRLREEDLDESVCRGRPNTWHHGAITGTCYLAERALQQLEIWDTGAALQQTIDLEADAGLVELRATASRVFAKVDTGDTQQTALVTFDLDDASLTRHELDGAVFGQGWSLRAVDDQRVLIQSPDDRLGLVDTTDPAQPQVELTGLPGTGGCSSPVFDDGALYCAMGLYGVERVQW